MGKKLCYSLEPLVTNKTTKITVSEIKQREPPEAESQLLGPNNRYSEPMSPLLTEQTSWTQEGPHHSRPGNCVQLISFIKLIVTYVQG